MNIIHNIGYTCNNNCIFCGIAAIRENVPDLSTDEIRNKLTNAKHEGANELIFSGGECTIRPDFIEIIRIAKECGYNHIEITTNGRMFSYYDYAKKITDAGLSFIRVSLHGPDVETHESITRTSGSFAETVKGIENLCKIRNKRQEENKPPIFIEITCAVNNFNYKRLNDMMELFNNFDLTHVDMNFVIPWGAAYEYFYQLVPKYSEAMPFMREQLDKNDNRDVKITKVANVPLCFMLGYENYVSELFELMTKIINPLGEPFNYSGHRSAKKVKTKKCEKCSYYNICEGIYSQYYEKYGDVEIEPIEGKQLMPEDVASLKKEAK